MNQEQIKQKFFQNLGIENPSDELVEKLQEYLDRVILETLLRRATPGQVEMIEKAYDGGKEEDLENAVSAVAQTIPGLAEEIEAALMAELDSFRKLSK